MGRRATWDNIKRSKNFYVNSYRGIGSALLVSVILNFCLGIGIFYSYFNKPERDFYATNGETPPVQLTPLDSPNESSTPLLPDDPDRSENDKAVVN